MDDFRQDFTIYVESGESGSEIVERLGIPWRSDDEPSVGDPDGSGLNDTAAGNLIYEVCWNFGPPSPWAIENGIEDLAITNKEFDSGDGVDVTPGSKVWKDEIHVRPAASVIAAIERLVSMIDDRHPEIARRVATGPKGHGQNDEDVMEELSEEFGIIQRHLEWADKNRTNAVVTLIFRQG